MAVGKNLKRSSNDGIMIFLEKRGRGGSKYSSLLHFNQIPSPKSITYINAISLFGFKSVSLHALIEEVI